MGVFLVESEVVRRVYKHIIHIDDQPPFIDEISEGMVHVGLESGWGVAESKEHNGWLEDSKRGGESCLPPVFWADENVVVSPVDVEFGKDFTVF